MVVKRRSVSKKRKTVSKRKTNSKRKPVKRSVSKKKTNSKRKPVKRSVSKRKTNSKRKVVKRSVSKRKIKRGGSMSPEQFREEQKMKVFRGITIKIPDGKGNNLSYTLGEDQYKDISNHGKLPEEGYLLYKNQTNAIFKPVLKSEFIKNDIIIEARSIPPRSIPLGNLISRKNSKNKNENSQAIKKGLIEAQNIKNSENISVFPIYEKDGYIFYLVVEFSEEKKLFVSQTYVKVLCIVADRKNINNKKN